jgi:hypothetical protein
MLAGILAISQFRFDNHTWLAQQQLPAGSRSARPGAGAWNPGGRGSVLRLRQLEQAAGATTPIRGGHAAGAIGGVVVAEEGIAPAERKHVQAWLAARGGLGVWCGAGAVFSQLSRQSVSAAYAARQQLWRVAHVFSEHPPEVQPGGHLAPLLALLTHTQPCLLLAGGHTAAQGAAAACVSMGSSSSCHRRAQTPILPVTRAAAWRLAERAGNSTDKRSQRALTLVLGNAAPLERAVRAG